MYLYFDTFSWRAWCVIKGGLMNRECQASSDRPAAPLSTSGDPLDSSRCWCPWPHLRATFPLASEWFWFQKAEGGREKGQGISSPSFLLLGQCGLPSLLEWSFYWGHFKIALCLWFWKLLPAFAFQPLRLVSVSHCLSTGKQGNGVHNSLRCS